ncbi:YhdH/YhfP family quinone oxidoreductase [Hutsoniella sourekii]|uniref:YhdH/YhfP family quinone oxidoreductase n=1 Tax=Hutsoniella sourekii TaxID=87650 RepID=UPI000480654C|nr:YhdH/YhfP family quinone oxidoreductase [Hutsoniella sourekii]
MTKFKAIVVRETENKDVDYAYEDLTVDQLDKGTTLVEVHYSSLNYKDMLGFQKNGGVIRTYPMIPGIDVSGVVVEDTSGNFQAGDEVVINGCNMGVDHTGGFSEYVRVPSEWMIKLPEGLSMKDAMIIGTAGYTAAQSIYELEQAGMSPDEDPEILVTGASGGVGSVALAILKKIGYSNLTALIRKDYQEEIVRQVGATAIITPDELGPVKPLGSQRFHHVVDTVGGETAASALCQIYMEGSMSMCGNAGGNDFPTTVLPLILRGVKILGINSLGGSWKKREEIWRRLGQEWQVIADLNYHEISFEEIPETVQALKDGKHLGRTIVKMK